MPEFYIVFAEGYQPDGCGERLTNQDLEVRCIAKIDGEKTAREVCEALSAEYAGEPFAAPHFEPLPVSRVTNAEAARWEVRLIELADRSGRADSDNKRSRDAAYHDQAQKLEWELRKRLKASEGFCDGGKSPRPGRPVWPLYPLASGLPNQTCDSPEAKPGKTIIMRETHRGAPMMFARTYTPLGRVPIQSVYETDHPYYVATDRDLAVVAHLYPDADAADPSWPNIEADLIVAGRSGTELRTMNAPTLIRLLEKPDSESTPDAAAHRGREKSKGGRPAVSKAETQKREQLVKDWLRAKALGTCQKDFCEDKGIPVKRLETCINWDTQRRRRAEP